MHAARPSTRRGGRRTGLAAASIGLALLALAACSSGASDDAANPSPTSSAERPTPSAPASALPGPSASATPEPSASPDATATPSPSPDPLSGEAISIACDEVLTLQDVYDYNPNIGTDPGYRPRVGSGAEKTAELSGVACGWINQTSAETYSVGVARFGADELERVRTMLSAAGGTPVGGGLDGRYRVESGVGVIDIIVDSYWVSAESRAFLGADDARPLLEAIERNLP